METVEDGHAGTFRYCNRIRISIARSTATVSFTCALHVFFIFLPDDPKHPPYYVPDRRLMWCSGYEQFPHLRHSLNQSGRVGLFRQFDRPEEEECGCYGATFGAFDLPSLEESVPLC